ncbi:MAG TPA: hypothetical protein PLH60_08000 [Proteiniphilum sp.]|nr:hypothetical protein [Proteiniphilum sp.]
MKQLSYDSIMADVLAEHNELIPVLNRSESVSVWAIRLCYHYVRHMT